MNSRLIIVGTGLFAEMAREYFNELSDYNVEAFSCHEKYKEADSIYELPLISVEDLVKKHLPQDVTLFVAIGYGEMNKIRQRVYEELKAHGYSFATFVYPGVKIWDNATLGDNVFIFEDNTIQPYTRIGSNTIFWSGNHIGHHSSIGSHCFISSHVVVSGSCHIGNNVFIGVNATLHDSLNIGDECLIGAGAIINKNTQAKSVFVPAATKIFPKNSEEIGF